MLSRIVIASLTCIIISAFTSFVISRGFEVYAFLGFFNSILFVLVYLLFPFSGLKIGVWVGIVAWLIGGFFAGVLSENCKGTAIAALLSLLLSIFIASSLDNQIFTSLGFNTTVLLIDFLTSFGLIITSAISGFLIKRKLSEYIDF